MKLFLFLATCLIPCPAVALNHVRNNEDVNDAHNITEYPPSTIVRSLEEVEIVAFDKSSVDPKLGTELTRLYENYQFALRDEEDSAEEPSVAVDVSFSRDMDNDSAEQVLRAGGVQVDFIACFAHLCSVRIPVSSLKNLSSIDSVQVVHTTHSVTNAGSALSEGDRAMFADLARTKYSVDGKGLMIGVLSDSFDCEGGGALNDIFSEDLPSGAGNILIIADLSPSECVPMPDEGRAMMQLIHDVAPGARLAFHTAFRGQGSFASGILLLAAAGCDIIVDDVISLNEPMFQDGAVAQAVDKVVTQGIPYFSAAGNYGRNSWVAESGFEAVNINNVIYHRFGFDSSGLPITRMKIIMQPSAPLVLQWDQPYLSVTKSVLFASASDIDIYLYSNNVLVGKSEDNNLGMDPIEFILLQPSQFSTNNAIPFEFEIVYKSGPLPTYMKLVVASGSTATFEFPTVSGTSYGHLNSALGAGVGAAKYSSTPVYGVSPPKIKSSSSAGGTPILFAIDGARYFSPVVRKQPRFTGPDGGATTFFGDLDDQGVYRFSGTSAAAPHVAAVAALMLQLKGGRGSLTPAEIYSILGSTAIDMDDPFTGGFDRGFDFKTGAGFVNALASLDALAVNSDFTLVDANEDTSLGALGNRIDYSSIPSSSNNLNIEASFPLSEVRSVRFTFDGLSVPCRSSAPFRVFDGIGKKIRLNNHVVKATPYYDSDDCRGTAGLTRSQNFTVTGCSLRLVAYNALRRNSITTVSKDFIFRNIRCAANFEVVVVKCGFEEVNTVRMILKKTRTNTVVASQTDSSAPYFLHPQVSGKGYSIKGRYTAGSYSLLPIIDGISHPAFTFKLDGNCV